MTQRCPHCGIGQISLAKKLLFGPLFRFQCGHCGQRWRVSYWAVVVAILAIVGTPTLAVLSWSIGLVRPGASSLLSVAFLNFALAILAVTYWVPVRRVGGS